MGVVSVKPEILKNVGKLITTIPEKFSPHRGIQRVYDQRKQMIETGEGVDWATAEALAFATLLVEGNHVRLSGQDVERGTFSHRHSVLHDQKTGETYCPLDHVLMNQEEEMFTVSNRYFVILMCLQEYMEAGSSLLSGGLKADHV
jgi:2-oxoglutarate dehydrogenase E1 component